MTDTAERLQRGVAMLRNEYSAAEIGAMLNYSPRTIRRWNAQPREKYLAEKRENHTRVVALHKKGKSAREIQSATGYALSTVYAILKKLA